jgi:DNA processing protein
MDGYPNKLRDARHPIEMLYFQGTWELAETRSVAVVGSRNATEDGKKRAAKISKALVEKGFAVVSGLAAGIDGGTHRSYRSGRSAAGLSYEVQVLSH